ncbi:serine hydroxymethyltransferase [Cryptosporangium arvum]|uniref:Serine hydroxymethyltransferase n=1 Tax=Cryptosporangium arvum DSM 44712 TaxID=927661 RepID=A0A010YZD8_9ACTN|nr:serine hydroxymethyltransferase [Cryptosporangium arvum]EXG80583.1 glycine/serine hydroxymethyltransferase [Cryptosporangium arvum DSM 44712]
MSLHSAVVDGYRPAGLDGLRSADPEVAEILTAEYDRVRHGVQLTASENFTSAAVRAVLGSTLGDKHAEGYPGRRYYGGCEFIDQAEELGRARACALFGAEHANLQPHSGTLANLAAFAALLVPGDTVLAMEPRYGGHFTSGSSRNFSGKWFHTVGYGVRRSDERLDYDEIRDLARQHLPKLIVCGPTAYTRLIDYAAFREIADEVGAYFLVDAAQISGLVAGRAVPSPVPYADVVTTTSHKSLRGPRGGIVLCTRALARRVDNAVFPFLQGAPQMNNVAAKTVALGEAGELAFVDYAQRVLANASALADGLESAGLRLVTGGTDNHMVLVDLGDAQVSGAEAEQRCRDVGILLTKHVLPFDHRLPEEASGLRLGTLASTTQGMTEADMEFAAELIVRAIRGEQGVGDDVADLAARYPCYSPH